MSEGSVDYELYRGALGIAVLSLLAVAEDHGYGLSERLVRRSEGALEVSQGAIYPILHRLESRGHVASRWERTSNNRKAKIYSITPKGIDWYEQRSKQWHRLSAALSSILPPTKLSIEGA